MQPLRFTLLCLFLTACGNPPAKTNNGNNNGNNNGTNNGGTNNGTSATNNGTTTTNNGTGTNNGGRGLVALAASADFATSESAWHVVTIDPDTTDATSTTTAFGTGDLGVSVGDRWAYVLDRNAGRIQVLSTPTLEDAGVFDVDPGANPQFATDVDGKIFVSLYGSSAVAVATPDASATGFDVSTIDLASYDPTDGNPEASAIAADEGFVLVVLQTLTEFSGVENSQLLAIRAEDDAPGEAIDLGVKNAQAGLERTPEGQLTVGYTGDYGVLDGGVVRLRRNGPGDFQPDGDIVTEEQLGGDLLDYVVLGPHEVLAVISLEDFSTQLVWFVDASEGDFVLETLPVSSPGFAGLDTAAAWWVAGSRQPAIQGFEIFVQGAVEPTEHIPTALPPAGIVFID